MSKAKAIYIIGGAGSGKSTLMQSLLKLTTTGLDPVKVLHTELNKADHRINLYGQEFNSKFFGSGVYLDKMRSQYPGTDALGQGAQVAMKGYLSRGLGDENFILGEGYRFTTRPVLELLGETHDLTLVHLSSSIEYLLEKAAEAGKETSERQIRQSVTQSGKVARELGQGSVELVSKAAHSFNPDQFALDLIMEVA